MWKITYLFHYFYYYYYFFPLQIPLVLSFGAYFSIFSSCLHFFVCFYELSEKFTTPGLNVSALHRSFSYVDCMSWVAFAGYEDMKQV